eukprot:1159671-Pelagomonas_calceolata.AAC.4
MSFFDTSLCCCVSHACYRHPESSLWLRSLLPQLQTLNGCTSTPAPDGSIAPGLPSSQDSPLPFLVPDHQQQKVLRTSVKDGSCDQQAAECTELRSQTARLQQPLCAVTALHGEALPAVVPWLTRSRAEEARMLAHMHAD